MQMSSLVTSSGYVREDFFQRYTTKVISHTNRERKSPVSTSPTAETAENASELRVKCDVSSETDVSDAVGKVLQH